MELTVHDKDVHEQITLEPSCESSDTSTFASQIVDKPCDELVHSSSPTAGIKTVMTGEIHEVQGNEHNNRDSEQSHMEVIGRVYTCMRWSFQMIVTKRRLNVLKKAF